MIIIQNNGHIIKKYFVIHTVLISYFNKKKCYRIISTDALARGIDIPDCNYVISYDPPRNIKTYVHRVGRTGRAGRKGTAVTILLHNQMQMFKVIVYYKP